MSDLLTLVLGRFPLPRWWRSPLLLGAGARLCAWPQQAGHEPAARHRLLEARPYLSRHRRCKALARIAGLALQLTRLPHAARLLYAGLLRASRLQAALTRGR
ncbi:hypothetical protein H8A99_36710, partial [Bradyrhizobium sp. Arg68]|uniref:hypothetical protein n=1 Tax=Bradyrhizobium ivorense TaxID=2511166 RepID=UPI001E400D3B